MSLLVVISIAFALALDAFAVALGAGSFFRRASSRQKFRLSFHFGLFQALMPIIGWYAGKEIVGYISEFDHWIAFLLLLTIASKMIYEAVSEKERPFSGDLTRGLSLVSLSVATSIDALAVGFSIGILEGPIILPAIIIGIVASLMTLVGIKAGEKLSTVFGSKVEIAGGLILIMIGVKIVLEHLEIV